MDNSLLEREKELKVLNDSLNMRCEASLQPTKKQSLAANKKPKKPELVPNLLLIRDETQKMIQNEQTQQDNEVNKAKRMIPENLVRRNVSTEGIIR